MESTEDRSEAIARLSAENTRRRESLVALGEKEPAAASGRVVGPARGALAALLISVGLVSAPVSVIAFWTKSELIDTTRFVATMAPLATDPAFQSFLVEQVVTVVDDQANLDGIAADLFDGLATLGLPPRATAAVGLLEGPAVHGVRTLIRPTCEQVLHSECFVLILVEATRISHTQLLAALIPAVDRTVPLIQADALVQAQVG